MEKRRLGQTEMEVSVLGLGGAAFGSSEPKAIELLLRNAIDAGVNVIDTAECYERSEELIGQTLPSIRKDVFVFTKVGHPRGVGSEDWSATSIFESIERSLRRLRTDWLDLVQLHGCSEAVLQKGEAAGALVNARERGMVRYIGYSGDRNEALAAVESGAFDTLQTSVSIADQEALTLTLPRARERRMGVIAKRPLANMAWKTGHKPMNPYHHEYWERLRKLHYEFLRDCSLDETVATALHWTLQVPGVHTAIVGTANPERPRENAQLLASRRLNNGQWQAIRSRWEEIAPKTWIGQS